jgi:hypothetical protein
MHVSAWSERKRPIDDALLRPGSAWSPALATLGHPPRLRMEAATRGCARCDVGWSSMALRSPGKRGRRGPARGGGRGWSEGSSGAWRRRCEADGEAGGGPAWELPPLPGLGREGAGWREVMGRCNIPGFQTIAG